ncbi:hypothetical protein AAEX63_03115 [Luteococcus sp. H138]|uniref:hypothetical protein n=1 Tax=unclassified Luteococcus TaxID=2639923 RepID=UPI00313CC614
MRGFLVVLGIGLVLLALAAWRDRQTRRVAETRLGIPVERLHPRASEPDESQRAALQDFRAAQPRVDARLADDRFASWDSPATAEVTNADLLCCPEGMGGLRELLPSLQRARADHRCLVVVAPAFDEDLLTQLAATTGPARPLALRADPDACHEIARITGATPADRVDLQSGAAGKLHGKARRLVCDATACWLEASTDQPQA